MKRSRSGETALIYAAEYNRNPECISALLKSGAGINDRDFMGRTPLILAAEHGRDLRPVVDG